MNEHLRVVRTWIQGNAYNGDTVHWGSSELLNLRMLTVKDLELLAQSIADATVKELLPRLKHINKNLPLNEETLISKTALRAIIYDTERKN